MKIQTCIVIAAMAFATSSRSQTLFSESFDSEASANVLESSQGETEVEFVDYSNFTIGVVDHNIVEAPNQIAGSPATRGVIMQVNRSTGVSSLVNLIAADAPGGNGVNFSGNYRLTCDMYLSLDPSADRGSAGTTEAGLWGIGTDGVTTTGRTNRNVTAGTWGWVSTEGGFGTEDAIFVIDKFPQVAKHGDATSPGLFQAAFLGGTPIASTPNNSWTRVEITVLEGNVSVKYNGVEFFNEPSDKTEGFALIGYEDTFTSLSFSPDYQFALFDNMVVEVAQQPTLVVTQTSAFNPVTESGAMTTATFSIENNGDSSVTVSEINLTGEAAGDIAHGSVLPIVIPAAGNAEVTLTYTAAGEREVKSADVEFVSDDAQSPSISRSLEVIFAPTLLAHYKFDEAEGTVAIDSSGNGADGAFAERDPLGYASESLAGAGTSIDFTEANAADTGNFAFMRPLHVPTTSISMWVKPSAAGTSEDTLFNRDPFFNAADAIYGCFIDDVGALSFKAGGQLDLQSEAEAVQNDVASHIVITHLDEDGFGNSTATRSRMYINGVMVAENNNPTGFDRYPSGSATQSLFIATRTAAGSGYSGLIDDVQIYSVELQPFQIDSMFNVPGSIAPEGLPDPFQFTAVAYDSDAAKATLTWNSLPGRFYILFESTDLINWEEVDDGILSGGFSTTYEVMAVPATPGRRFYRLESEQ